MGKLSDVSRATVKSLREHVTVEPIMFILSMTNYIRTPSSQLLVLDKVCQQNYNDTVCSDIGGFSTLENDIQATTAYWNFYLKMAFLIPWSVVSTLYGPLSDRLGRRLFLIVPSVGNIIGAASFICQSIFPHMPLDYLIASEVVVGISGNAYIVAKSYLCDVTDSTNRTKRLGVMKVMSHIGGPVGGFLAGILIDQKGFCMVYSIIVGIHVFVILYVLLWLEETVDYSSDQEDDMDSDADEEEELEFNYVVDQRGDDKEEGEKRIEREDEAGGNDKKVTKRREEVPEKEKESTTCDFLRLPLIELGKSLRLMFLVCFRKRQGSGRKYLLLAMLIGIIHSICSTAESDLIVIYSKLSPLNWSSVTIGVFISLRTSLKAATLAIGLPVIFKFVKNHTLQLDLGLASVGIVSTSACLFMIAFSKSTGLMMAAAVVGMLVSFPSVAITSFKSKLVDPREYGSLFAVTALIQILCSVAGSWFFNMLYISLLPFRPGMTFLMTVVFYILSLLLILYIWHDMKTDPNGNEMPNDGGSKYMKLENLDEGKQEDGNELRDRPKDG